MFEEAGKLYLGNSSFYRYPERIDIVNSIFGLLLLPMCKDRRIIADELEVILYAHESRLLLAESSKVSVSMGR